MKTIKILGTGCAKCKSLYQNTLEAVKLSGIEATVEKVEDIQEILSYHVLTTPVLWIDGKSVIRGRVAEVTEIRQLLLQ
ncbi:MAG: thioredoxin family protein [Bacteroidetes bacterium]|nr:thioredoxin family protein [Bacteroidota bacterium]